MTMRDLTPGIGEISALLGRGTQYRGKLTFEGRVRVDGQFEGEVFSEGMLIIGEGADIDATIDVGTLIVLGGVVRGQIRARELVELHAASKVHADIETGRIFVGEGAHFDGRCQMRGGGEPERHAMESSTKPAPADPASAPDPGLDPKPDAEPDAPQEVADPVAEEGSEAPADDGDGEPLRSTGDESE